MGRVEWLLVVVVLVQLARIVQAFVQHKERQALLSDLATMIGDHFDVVERRRLARLINGEAQEREG